MKLSIISFTNKGMELSKRIKKQFPGEKLFLYTKCSFGQQVEEEKAITHVDQSLSEWTGQQMKEHRGLLFIGACGIAVRAIAPFLTDKLNDAPVLVMDEQGRYVIPLLAGHVGGANELAQLLQERTGAIPVITTATDLNHRFAVDLFARKNELQIVNKDGIARISSAILAGEEITMAIEEGHWEEEPVPEGIRIVSWRDVNPPDLLVAPAEKGEGRLLTLRPKEYVIGAGCRRGKEAGQIEEAIRKVLKSLQIGMEQVAALTSIDRKKDEEGLLAFSERYGIPFLTYSAEELEQTEGEFHASAFVRQQVGVDNVCERAALHFCGPNGILVSGKHAENGITVAIAKREWRVSFHEK